MGLGRKQGVGGVGGMFSPFFPLFPASSARPYIYLRCHPPSRLKSEDESNYFIRKNHQIMPSYQVIVKRIVSSHEKMIAKAKSIASASSNTEGETNQSVSVTVNSDKISSCSSSSSQAKVPQ